jgi:hypothetical protein
MLEDGEERVDADAAGDQEDVVVGEGRGRRVRVVEVAAWKKDAN